MAAPGPLPASPLRTATASLALSREPRQAVRRETWTASTRPTQPSPGQVLTRLALPPDRPLRRIRDQHHGTSQRCPATKRSGRWPTPPTIRTNCRPHGCADRRYLRGSGMLVGLLAVMLRPVAGCPARGAGGG